jgi:hypothetical protein
MIQRFATFQHASSKPNVPAAIEQVWRVYTTPDDINRNAAFCARAPLVAHCQSGNFG